MAARPGRPGPEAGRGHAPAAPAGRHRTERRRSRTLDAGGSGRARAWGCRIRRAAPVAMSAGFVVSPGWSWCCRVDSNHRPRPYQGRALPAELRQRHLARRTAHPYVEADPPCHRLCSDHGRKDKPGRCAARQRGGARAGGAAPSPRRRAQGQPQKAQRAAARPQRAFRQPPLRAGRPFATSAASQSGGARRCPSCPTTGSVAWPANTA